MSDAKVQKDASGKKTIVGTKAAPAPASGSEELRVDERLQGPGKYELEDDETFRVEFYVRRRDKRWTIVANPAVRDKSVEKHWVEFRMWNYEEAVELRKKATVYDTQKRVHLLDHDMLNRLKIQRLMRRWSFGDDNPRLRLLHVNGVLVDESWDAFRKRLHPNIAAHIVDQMNLVLDFNG